MSDEGRGGFWNRAGRQSGGSRPRQLDVVVPFACPHCGNADRAKLTQLYNPLRHITWERCDECKRPTGRQKQER